MVTRTTLDSSEVHDSLIRRMVTTLGNDLHHTDIKADHIGHPNGSPEEVNGSVPDISSKKDGMLYITEAETYDSIDLPDTEKQFRAFSRANAIFFVAVPQNCYEIARQKLNNMGINAKIYVG